MNDFEYKSIEQKKQEVLQEWLQLTQRNLESIDVKEFLSHTSLENLSIQEPNIRKDIGRKILRKNGNGLILKLDEWLDSIYEFTIKKNENRGVWISKGSTAFHIERDCKWFQKGLNFKADFHQRSVLYLFSFS